MEIRQTHLVYTNITNSQESENTSATKGRLTNIFSKEHFVNICIKAFPIYMHPTLTFSNNYSKIFTIELRL